MLLFRSGDGLKPRVHSTQLRYELPVHWSEQRLRQLELARTPDSDEQVGMLAAETRIGLHVPHDGYAVHTQQRAVEEHNELLGRGADHVQSRLQWA
jgi:hypothetical protein